MGGRRKYYEALRAARNDRAIFTAPSAVEYTIVRTRGVLVRGNTIHESPVGFWPYAALHFT